MMNKLKNPFLTRGYIAPKYFCDREKETSILIEAIQNKRNITMYSRRKLGKTALIKHIFNQLQKTYICIWVDLLPAQDFNDMVNIMANRIFQSFEDNQSISQKILNGFKALRPVISYDELTGLPQVKLDVNNISQVQNSFVGLLKLLQEFNKPVIIALDEFQQVLKFPEKDTEAYLRTIMQNLPEISFIYSGSDQHMLTQMFLRSDKPFYQMSQMFKLDIIEQNSYVKFIKDHFNKGGKQIKEEDIRFLLEWTDGITYYVQFICNRIYSLDNKNINRVIILSILNQVLHEFEDNYFVYREMLTRKQWRVLAAIAKEEKVQKIYSKYFMSKYGFYNASYIKKALDSLENNHLIYKTNVEGKVQYQLQDLFLSKWLKKQ